MFGLNASVAYFSYSIHTRKESAFDYALVETYPSKNILLYFSHSWQFNSTYLLQVTRHYKLGQQSNNRSSRQRQCFYPSVQSVLLNHLVLWERKQEN